MNAYLRRLSSLLQDLARLSELVCRVAATEAFLLATGPQPGRRESGLHRGMTLR